jgi:tetratricopeptide (TPR) repeat protein
LQPRRLSFEWSVFTRPFVKSEALQRQSRLNNLSAAFLSFGMVCSLLSLVALVPSASAGNSQSASNSRASGHSKDQPSNLAEVELRKRLEAAQAAQATGDTAAIAQANSRTIALALRELAQIRLLETALPQAIDLYRRSLTFEDNADTHVDLAIAQLQSALYDDALAEASAALTMDSNNARALTVQSRVWIKRQQFSKAAAAISRAAQIDPSYQSDLETMYSLGLCYLQSGDPTDKPKATAVFDKMIQTQGDSGSLHVLFGRAYRDAGEMPAAIREFQRAIALDPRTPHAHYFLGLARLAVNEWKATPEARAEFAKELEYYPRDYLANYLVGFLASGDRDYPVSDRYLKIAAGIDPNAPEPWLYLGLNAYASADMAHAEEYLRKAVVLTGTDEARSNYQIRRAYVDLGRILAKSGRTEESEVFLTKARDLQNKTMELTQQDVAVQMKQAGVTGVAAVVDVHPGGATDVPVTTSTTDADPFARIDPSVSARSSLTKSQLTIAESQEDRLRSVLGLSFNDLATSEAVSKNFSQALTHYQEAERWDNKIPGLYRDLGLAAYRAKDYPEAIRGLSAALSEKPNDPPVRAMLGTCLFTTDKYSEAAKTFTPLGNAGMRDSAVGYAWAASLARINEPAKATQVLLEFEKGNRPPDVLLLIGQLWIEIGDYARSVQSLHAALQADPQLAKAHYYAGQAYTRWEHWPEAAVEFQSELTLSPGDPDAMYGLGFVDLQQSRIDEAAKLFEQVIASYPSHANSQYQYGKILLDRGQIPEAVSHLEIAARLNPQADYMHYQLQIAYRKDSRTADADRELDIYKELKAKQREHDRQAVRAAQDNAKSSATHERNR